MLFFLRKTGNRGEAGR